MFDVVWRAVAIGIGATVLMDLWAILLNKVLGQARPNWAPVGRWVWHLREGKVFHDDIGQAMPYQQELALGWAFHYLVGITYGIILIIVTGPSWLAAPTFLPAFVLGIVTVGAGWFLLAPGMGAGWAASKRPNPMQIRTLNLVSHTVFALGLYGTALLIR
jgi:FtsH-binding integral membrane protein